MISNIQKLKLRECYDQPIGKMNKVQFWVQNDSVAMRKFSKDAKGEGFYSLWGIRVKGKGILNSTEREVIKKMNPHRRTFF